MRLLFDPDFDFGGWPGPLGIREAVAGVRWVGSAAFLANLETRLGVAGRYASKGDRVAGLVPRLFRADAFYAASARADPWATAERLLEWRDQLWECGWRGERLGERRLGELGEVTLGLHAGTAERLERVAACLKDRPIDIESVGLLLSRAWFSPAWRSVLSELERQGTRIVEKNPLELPTFEEGAPPAHRPDLQLYRPYGPLEAARSIAATLASDPGLGETLFVSPDDVLDNALAEFGLPTLGCRSTVGSTFADVLRLTLALVWSPVDPQVAIDWLSLPELPIARSLARQLASTLENWPAVQNPSWQAAVNATRLGSETERSDIKALEIVFTPLAERNGQLHIRDLTPRLDLLESWAGQGGSPEHRALAHQIQALRLRFESAELTRLSQPQLDAVLRGIGPGLTGTNKPALAGYVSVGRAGGVAGAIRRIIWWQFLDERSARRPIRLRISERTALMNAGIRLPTQADTVRAAAAGARRPLTYAGETLVLVAPQYNQAGERSHPHTVWDEMVGKFQDPTLARRLLVDRPTFGNVLPIPAVRSHTAPKPIEPKRLLQVHQPIVSRAVESPSSLGKLIGCSYAYAVEYIGRIRSRSLTRIATENRLFGSLAHDVLAEVARSGALLATNPREIALTILQKTLPTHAALLLFPAFQHDLLLLQNAVGAAATLLAEVMQKEALRVWSAEAVVKAQFSGHECAGTPDLVLEDLEGRLVLLDYKWSGNSYRTEELRAGTALQLAAYAALLEASGRQVRTMGYLILTSGRLIVRGIPLSGARQVHPDSLASTWSAAERAWNDRTTELLRGEVFAEGIATETFTPIDQAMFAGNTKTGDAEPRLKLPPPCGYCGLDLLCGRRALV